MSKSGSRRPQGWVSLTGITCDGQPVPVAEAFRRGWIKTPYVNPTFRDYLDLSEEKNLFLDQGRQLLAYAWGFRAPIENYTVQKYMVGTGLTPAKVTDVAMEAPIALPSQGNTITAPITSVDFMTSFVVRVSFSIAQGDANGYLITEYGLASGNNTLIARKVRSVGINKTSDFSPSFSWRIRF